MIPFPMVNILFPFLLRRKIPPRNLIDPFAAVKKQNQPIMFRPVSLLATQVIYRRGNLPEGATNLVTRFFAAI